MKIRVRFDPKKEERDQEREGRKFSTPGFAKGGSRGEDYGETLTSCCCDEMVWKKRQARGANGIDPG